jgi:lipoprotein-anchoring transpeptidase ErfK/SrfK
LAGATTTTAIRRITAAIVATLCLSLIAGACSLGGGQGASASPTPSVPAAQLSITPADGVTDARPQSPIRFSVTNGGNVAQVTVTTHGHSVPGRLTADGTAWRSRWALEVSTRYTVRVVVRDTAGRFETSTSSFRTLTPRETFSAQIFQGQGQTYGVGMPVILTFSQPITNPRAVERSLQLWTSKRVVGAWHWDDPSTLFFRPRDYWPAHTGVRFVGHLNGVEGAPGVYGVHTLTQSFVIGRSLIAVADTSTHHVRIYLERRPFADWALSAGKPGDETPNGTYLAIEKQNPAEMKGPGYDIMVPWSVRFTWSGAYMHAAPWSVGSQGYANVSHGCINLSPAHAETYYRLAVPGDPVTVGGSPRGGVYGNGWTVWFLSWKDWWRGSALHKAVRAGPGGSRFVDPATVRRSRALPPLGRPKNGNATPS